MAHFEDNDYGGEVQGYLGGYYGAEAQILKTRLSPEDSFRYDLFSSYNFLSEYITESEFNLLVENIYKFNHKLQKNPSLILIALIVVKRSRKKPIEPNVIRSVYSDEMVSALIKENSISQYDILRYSRFFILHMDSFVKNLKERY